MPRIAFGSVANYTGVSPESGVSHLCVWSQVCIASLGMDCFPRKWRVWEEGTFRRDFYALRENFWLSLARENLPQAIFLPQKMLGVFGIPIWHFAHLYFCLSCAISCDYVCAITIQWADHRSPCSIIWNPHLTLRSPLFLPVLSLQTGVRITTTLSFLQHASCVSSVPSIPVHV